MKYFEIWGRMLIVAHQYHTAGSNTIFIQIYMDALPGVPGISKNQKKIPHK